MKNISTILSALVLFALPVSANESHEKAIETTKIHLGAVLRGDSEKMQNTYAPQVTLLPGHELLKPKYALSENEGRKEALKVERGKLVQTISDARQEKAVGSKEKLSKLLESFDYKIVEVKEGKIDIVPSGPVATRKLGFEVKQGEVVIKASLAKGDDFVLFHLRRNKDSWQIVSEYLD